MTIVTIRLPDMDCDDCIACRFNHYQSAIEFAAECAERINKSVWHDCVCNHDGRVCEALAEWNDLDAVVDCSGRIGQCSITLSSEWTEPDALRMCSK